MAPQAGLTKSLSLTPAAISSSRPSSMAVGLVACQTQLPPSSTGVQVEARPRNGCNRLSTCSYGSDVKAATRPLQAQLLERLGSRTRVYLAERQTSRHHFLDCHMSAKLRAGMINRVHKVYHAALFYFLVGLRQLDCGVPFARVSIYLFICLPTYPPTYLFTHLYPPTPCQRGEAHGKGGRHMSISEDSPSAASCSSW